MPWAAEFGRDLRVGLRQWRRHPGFASVALLSLVLGIGATTAVFTLAEAVFLQPVPVPDPGRAVIIYTQNTAIAGNTYLPTSYENLRDYGTRSREFASYSIVMFGGVSWQKQGGDQSLTAELVNPGFFPTLGARIAPGRDFLPEEDGADGAHPVVVLSHHLWVREFGSDPHVVGQTISLNRLPFTVVGVAPDGFRGVPIFGGADLWMPMAMHDPVLTGIIKDWFHQRERHFALAVARLAPGVPLGAARQAMHAVALQLDAQYPTDNRGNDALLVPLSQANIGPNARPLFVRASWVLGVIAALVLLIACANVANLLLVRAAERRREWAIRQALGAGRARLLRQLLSESLLLAGVAAVLALAFAEWAGQGLLALRPAGFAPRLHFALDPQALLFTLAVAIAASVVFGLGPGLRASSSARLGSLGERNDAAASGGRHWNARGLLVAAQAAFSLVALAAAGLFVHSLINAQRVQTGFDTAHLIEISPGGQPTGSPQSGLQYFQSVAERLRALPGVAGASLADAPLLLGGTERLTFRPTDDLTDMRQGKLTPTTEVGLDYFHTLGVALLAGRDFDSRDTPASAMTAIVNQRFADVMWPGESPIGRHLRFNLETWDVTVVGEAPTVKWGSLGEAPQPQIYLPMVQHPGSAAWLVRTRRDPAAALPSLRAAVRAVNPQLPPPGATLLQDRVAQQLTAPRLGAELLAIFAALALLLAAIGTYGVLAYMVTQRSREIGIRLALGATRGAVARLIMGAGMGMVLAGLAVGGVCTVMLSRSLAGLLYGLPGFDAASFAAAAALLLAMGFAACALPALRALGVDPAITLRGE